VVGQRHARAALPRQCAGKIHFNIILKSALGFTTGVCLSAFPVNILYIWVFLPLSCCMPLPSRIVIPDYPVKSWSSSLWNLLQFPVTSFLSGPNIFLIALLHKTLSLCSSCNVNDQVSHTYNTWPVVWVTTNCRFLWTLHCATLCSKHVVTYSIYADCSPQTACTVPWGSHLLCTGYLPDRWL